MIAEASAVDVTATALPEDRLQELRAQAARDAGPFVDPHVLRRAARELPSATHSAEWAGAILGHRFPGVRRLSWPEVVLLLAAREAEPHPPEPATVAAARERDEHRQRELAAEAERRVGAWRDVQQRLPVPVEVVHNYTSHRHLGHYEQGVDHIRVLEPLRHGRLTREAGQTLCWTPSRARSLTHLSDGIDDRLPQCTSCLRIAHRIAAHVIDHTAAATSR